MQITMVDGSENKSLNLSENVFDVEFKEGLIHLAVQACIQKMHKGTKAQKTRSEVRGGGAKPWRQKGTGRARAGTSRSPIWRSGGVTFAARVQKNKPHKINKKVYRKAMCSILSELLRKGRLQCLPETFFPKSKKTKAFVEAAEKVGIQDRPTLIVMHEVDECSHLSSRNVPNIDIVDVNQVNPYALVRYESVLVTEKALQIIEERLQ